VNKFIGEQLYENGFTDLVSVIPPGASLAPSSRIPPNQLGKVPGLKRESGLWTGYNWRKHAATAADVKQWSLDGANLGMRADHFPAVDIDCTDAGLAQLIEDFVIGKLGAAPVRVGRAPKRLLVFRTDVPFGRLRLWLAEGETHHLVEVLGSGQQYLMTGVHPATGLSYSWNTPVEALNPGALTPITKEAAIDMLDELVELIDMLGRWKVEREGDGKTRGEAAKDQRGLLAPSLDALREVMEHLPNTNELFPDRTSYLKIGYAIRAATGDEHEDAGFDMYSEWALKWDGNARFPKGNAAETVREDWRRFHGPFAVGFSYLAELARPFGYNDAANDFDALEPTPDTPVPEQPVLYSEQWLAKKIVQQRRGEIRYVPSQEKFLVWNRGRWEPDAVKLAEDVIKTELKTLARGVERHGSSPQEERQFARMALQMCSAAKATAVRMLLQSDRQIATSPDVLDHDPWVINTPNGIIDLKTGRLMPPDPDKLCTKSTAAPADFSGSAPEWHRFLEEATGGDHELFQYLKKLAGYVLTGSTREQILFFIWGPGGNGKSVFVNTLNGVLADYARTATMDTFTASSSDKHSTDIAMLHGARMVSASETQAGKRWDEARVKRLTGGESVTARFMRMDNFTYIPQFKLVFVGNHKPEIRDLDAAFRRRIHMVPFTVTPAVVDLELAAKLRAEFPAILAWMVEGCLLWQQEGLAPPEAVRDMTAEYFHEEDAVGRWLEEKCELNPRSTVLSNDLFLNWREWANRNGEFPGSLKRFSSALAARHLDRWREPDTRRMGFRGIQLKPDTSPLEI
jgi:P4 family phage/plasmid primase-like protien